MTKLINKYTKLCEIYGCNKYDRHPLKPKLQATPRPSQPAEILQIGIIKMSGEKCITCVDKFSKFVKYFTINQATKHFISQNDKYGILGKSIEIDDTIYNMQKKPTLKGRQNPLHRTNF